MAATATEAAMAGERPYNVLNYPKTGDEELDILCGMIELLNRISHWRAPRLLDYLQARYGINRLDSQTTVAGYDYANQPGGQQAVAPTVPPRRNKTLEDILRSQIANAKPDPALERLRDRVPDGPKPTPTKREMDALDRLNEELTKKLNEQI